MTLKVEALRLGWGVVLPLQEWSRLRKEGDGGFHLRLQFEGPKVSLSEDLQLVLATWTGSLKRMSLSSSRQRQRLGHGRS